MNRKAVIFESAFLERGDEAESVIILIIDENLSVHISVGVILHPGLNQVISTKNDCVLYSKAEPPQALSDCGSSFQGSSAVSRKSTVGVQREVEAHHRHDAGAACVCCASLQPHLTAPALQPEHLAGRRSE